MGRPTLFGERAGGRRVQGILTKTGTARFDEARERLARLSGWEAAALSDANVIEYLARGEEATRKALDR